MNYRRQRKRPQVSHADDWLMTYADMITLLLCFFAIFLSVSVPKKGPDAQVQKPESAKTYHGPDILEGFLALRGTPSTAQDYEDEAGPVRPTLRPQPEITRLQNQDGAKVEQKGDRITTMEMSSAAFFGSGSAVLSEAGKNILADVAQTLKSDKYKDYEITVEGHTDDSPIATPQFPSNWELSTARASAVVHYFLDQGISAQKLRAAGYADTFPKAPNRDASGNAIPENQAVNRRVVIKLEKIDKAA